MAERLMTLFLLPFCAGGPPLSAATLYRPSVVTPVLGKLQYRLACRTALVTKVAFLRNRIDHLNDAKGASDCASLQPIHFARPVVRYRTGKSEH